MTGGLDDTQLRLLEERLGYLRELEDRRSAILESIAEQGKLDDALKARILEADTKARLEDLYLPYKQKRRTKAQIAREAGLEPLALGLREDPTIAPEQRAAGFIDESKGVPDIKAALDGARQILMETIAEDAALLGGLRDWIWAKGQIRAKIIEGKENEGAKFRDYFDHFETIAKIPPHRLLALMRARNEGVLALELEPTAEPEQGHIEAQERVAAHGGIAARGRAADAWLVEACRLTWKVKLRLWLMLDLFARARETAEAEAIRVFGENLKDLMLAAPAGRKRSWASIPASAPRSRSRSSMRRKTARDHDDLSARAAPAVGPVGRRTRRAVQEARCCADLDRQRHRLARDRQAGRRGDEETRRSAAREDRVSEAGASVYSASELAAKEFPDLDVSLRGAVSIARRLQDPLAELVKIEPKAIGVGQYQHDVNQSRLARALDAKVEDCVNAVGVDVNTASIPLLARVAGLSASVAGNIVKCRDEHGASRTRAALKKVPRLGDKAFEQSAGFLRIAQGDNPLDAGSVHPEAYPVSSASSKAAAAK